MHEHLRHRLLTWWSAMVSRHPGWVLAAAALLVAASLYVTLCPVRLGPVRVGPLTFESNRNNLISPKLPWNQRFIDVMTNFPSEGAVLVVVDVGVPQGHRDYAQRRPRAEAAVDELARALRADSEHVQKAVEGYEFGPRAIRLTPTMEEFDKQLDEVRHQLGEMKVPLTSPTLAQMLQGGPESVSSSAPARAPGSASGPGPVPASAPAGPPDLAAAMRGLAQLVRGITRVLDDPRQRFDLLRLMADSEDKSPLWQYLTSENGRMFFVQVTPTAEEGGLNAKAPAIAAVKAIVAQVQARHRDVAIGITGIDVTEADETSVAEVDSEVAAIVAVVLITVTLMLAYRSARGPLLAMGSLLFGVAWAYGFATITIGHLQVLSVVFTIMLLGLGIAYGIYLQSRYELVRHHYPDDQAGFELAMRDTFHIMGPGIITGCITAAVSFATTMFSKFTGVAEMGIIAGGGILLCLVAMFSVFPVMLRLFRMHHRHVVPMADRRLSFFEERWALPFARHPWPTLVGAAAVLAASLGAVSQMRFNYNLIEIQPRGVPSIQWEDRIIRYSGESAWTGTSVIAPRPEDLPAEVRAGQRRLTEPERRAVVEKLLPRAAERKEKFRALSTVRSVRGIGLLLPEDDAQKRRKLEELGHMLLPLVRPVLEAPAPPGATTAPTTAATGPRLTPAQVAAGQQLAAELRSLRLGLAALQRVAELTQAGGLGSFLAQGALAVLPQRLKAVVPQASQPQGKAAIAQALAALDGALGTLDRLPPAERDARLAKVESDYEQARRELAHQMADLVDPAPLTLRDLPEELLRPYQDATGRIALDIVPKVPEYVNGRKIEGALDPLFLPQFVQQLKSVDPNVTGVALQIYESGGLIIHTYEIAGTLALLVVILIVGYDFGSLYDALLALVPVAVGFAATFGIMWACHALATACGYTLPIPMTVNPANIIVLPLMFGIGVDSGVHMIYRHRMDPRGQPPGLTEGTGKGITITNLTSILGFGVMIFSRHRGIASLGFVLSVGMALVMFSCWTVMPAWLELRNRRRPGGGNANGGAATTR